MSQLRNGIVLFDGFCVLCSNLVGALTRKLEGRVKFIAVQSAQGQYILANSKIGDPPGKASINTLREGTLVTTDEIYLVVNNKVYGGPDAVILLARASGGWLGMFGMIALLIPSAPRRKIYRWVADNRYLWFGKRDSCFVPEAGSTGV